MAAMTATMIHVESMQTAVPTRITGAGRTLPVAVSGGEAPPPLTAASLQRRFRAVLYYRGIEQLQAEEEEEERAVWVKESLSASLADHPEMAGRLRRRDDDDGGVRGPWEVRLNDNGVRLVQASVDMPMSAFLEAKDLARREAALTLWTDVDVHEPEFCAPFFMQLTRFQDGGYAIGASCSLLLADPLSLVDFLKAWARTHAEMRARGKPVAPPAVIQYARYLQSPGAAAAAVVRRLKSVPLDSCSAAAATTVLFRAAAGAQVDRHALAAACVDQAVETLGGNARKPPRLTVLAAGGSGELRVEACGCGDGEETTTPPPPSRGHHALRAAYWGDLGLGEIALDGSEPVHVSCTVVSPCADEGLVVVMAPAGGAELLISVTVPNY
ncbi:rosmarinate synthase [Oryza sativa Japonica Group]|uniref:OSJNBa0079A21.8 protein n=3 Tax=Oryza sativa TaxID=4530 RepID=Q7XU98_ORYSJ|nr:rosmarinate synthase [Oryza sativa Japonica Group]EAY95050.1 hypothetical protein OsI_16865 [Oryza sativa Indica Group]KAB8096329.1 hypothetical protein EE612_024734 [Oryza sativa]KAF2935182.1 hypothetical protein DAI22_04g214100 [Oryza sativa Japonica Group]CAD41464.3 OSJNBa0079A21.8 [Oryza sativa Japonica Group]BAF15383.2 Os04g0545700 [Oryza sativa Japonica Group]|eukprot:NP_001053469.2 Os04g0545700 [Oryza sativa Japonica Group]